MPEPRPPATPDEELLGAQRPAIVTMHSDAQRLARVHDELAAGFRALAAPRCGVSMFGSARTSRDHPD